MAGKSGVVFKTIISLLLISFLVYQSYAIFYKPITTATALSYETLEGVDITGYIVREERIINYTSKGAEHYVVKEGEKVAKGGTVAEIYSSSETVAAYAKIDEIEGQIATLESINSASDPSAVDLDTINNKIISAYFELINAGKDGSFVNSYKPSDELLTMLNRKQILTGEVVGFDSLLTSLRAKLASLKASLVSPIDRVKASASGYFVSNTDGLEKILDIKKIDTFDETIFEQIKSAKKTKGFGKIVSDYNWFIIAKMKNEEYLNFSVGSKMTINTSISGCEELSVTVHKINISDNKDSAVVIFSCNTMNGNIASTRFAPMTIVTKKYEGIRVNSKAVRVVDGKTGVYIIQGSIVKFRPIEIIYTKDNFAICKMSDVATSNSLRLYDEVIEKGKNLYDGKYIG